MSKFAFATVLAVVLTQAAHAGVYDKLTPEQKAKIDKGEQVVVTQEVASSAWPKVFIYQRIDATPEEAAAVFHDYEAVPGYQNDITKAKIVSRSGASTVIDYKLETPWASEAYTVRDTVSLVDGGKTYRDDWKLVKAEQMSAV